MMKYLKLTLAIPLLFMAYPHSPAHAAGCAGDILEGTLTTESGSVIYLSHDAWDAAFPSDPSPISFNSYYDEADPANPFGGSAWSEEFGWFIFDGDSGYFQSPNANPALWGGWGGVIDLSGIGYTDPSFTGVTGSGSVLTGGGATDTDDWYIGSGTLDFSAAFLSVGGGGGAGCALGEVNLFAEGVTSYTQSGSCPLTSVDLTWTTANVDTCSAASGPWATAGSRPTSNVVGETTPVSIPDGGSATFVLECAETITGTIVSGTAAIACTEGIVVPGGGTGTVDPEYTPI